MPVITDQGTLNVVLGVGDIRITTIEDRDTGMHMLAFSQWDEPAPIGGPSIAPETQEERLELLASHPMPLIISSVSKQGIDNLIRILQEVSDSWAGPERYEKKADQQ